jgi:16S rRNA (guanine966-N2)-methyltransferase
MRVIGGELKGRGIKAPKGRIVRPTSDKTREAIFDILQQEIKGRKVLDVFAGSGALGIEA